MATTPAGSCNSGSYDYTYYGNLLKTDVVTFSYSGVVDTVYYWKIRLIYWVITIDKWDSNSKLTTTFVTDTTLTPLVTKIDSSSMDMSKKVCEDGGDS